MMTALEFSVHAARVEYAGRVEGLLEAAVQGEQCGWQGLEDLATVVAAAKQGGMTAGSGVAARTRSAGSSVVSQRCAPPQSIRLSPSSGSGAAAGGIDRRHSGSAV